jgi:hypothetical protein
MEERELYFVLFNREGEREVLSVQPYGTRKRLERIKRTRPIFTPYNFLYRMQQIKRTRTKRRVLAILDSLNYRTIFYSSASETAAIGADTEKSTDPNRKAYRF